MTRAEDLFGVGFCPSLKSISRFQMKMLRGNMLVIIIKEKIPHYLASDACVVQHFYRSGPYCMYVEDTFSSLNDGNTPMYVHICAYCTISYSPIFTSLFFVASMQNMSCS